MTPVRCRSIYLRGDCCHTNKKLTWDTFVRYLLVRCYSVVAVLSSYYKISASRLAATYLANNRSLSNRVNNTVIWMMSASVSRSISIKVIYHTYHGIFLEIQMKSDFCVKQIYPKFSQRNNILK